ncbi:MAG: flagellar basal body P-ring formation chaperone FlgA, partial [Rhodospirillales bacterium]|nr:flagellar basal body P-ring formation chaperone FlgA [Rhodospirillales bacterium]
IFDNAGAKADTVVAHAPQPGKKLILDTRWLSGIAQANGVEWKPLGNFDRAVVERQADTIGAEQIQNELREALIRQGMPGNAEIELATRSFQIAVPLGEAARVAVHDAYYEARGGRFTAVIEAPEGAPNASRTRITGRVYTVTELPVPVRQISQGEVITAKDIEFQTVRDIMNRRDAITDPEQLIGRTPLHPLRPGVPVRAAEVQRPVVVPKGALVTMVMRHGALSITAQGKAIEAGGLGDVIRVANTHSNITVEAKIEGPSLVAVQPAGLNLSN